MDDKPVVTAIVGYRLPSGAYIARSGSPVTLDVAAQFAKYGWEVILDPFDLEALTRWEQIERAARKPRKWNQW